MIEKSHSTKAENRGKHLKKKKKKRDLRFLEEGETQDKPRRHMKDEKQRL